MTHDPKTLVEAVHYFKDPQATLETIIELRWPDGVTCPTCGSKGVRFISTRNLWECKNKHPKRQFSAKVGTIFEDSGLPLGNWFVAIWAVTNCKNGISSYELHRALGITQKSAWFMLHRIRLAMKAGSISMPSHGTFEADETLIVGKVENMHASRRKPAGTVIPDATMKSLHSVISETIEPARPSTQIRLRLTVGSRPNITHQFVDHAVRYVRDAVSTNGCENYFSLLKRSIKGTYVSVEPFHLGRYLDEQAFRFNERGDNDGGRFKTLLGSVFGLRLTYKDLTGHDAQPA